jgi:hypothetical protein
MQTEDGKLIVSMGYKNYKDLYLDYVNNFLTVYGFAGWHEINFDTAKRIINDAKYLYEKGK